MSIEISPSILSADFSSLISDISECEKENIGIFHIDVMDGHFVPNITIGSVVVESIRKKTKSILDTHLMIENPERYVEAFAKAGSDWITFHIETTNSPLGIIKKIKDLNVKAGISLNPGTPIEKIKPYLEDVFMVMVMSVNPGFGGQKFMPTVLSKVSRLKECRGKLKNKFKIGIDGGINFDTISEVVKAGAELVVAGSAVFKTELGIRKSIEKLRELSK